MKNLEDIHILVIGDIMIDHYINGEVERISPEAPVPIVHVTDEYISLGGCGNVARNIRETGANVTCLASPFRPETGLCEFVIQLEAGFIYKAQEPMIDK